MCQNLNLVKAHINHYDSMVITDNKASLKYLSAELAVFANFIETLS